MQVFFFRKSWKACIREIPDLELETNYNLNCNFQLQIWHIAYTIDILRISLIGIEGSLVRYSLEALRYSVLELGSTGSIQEDQKMSRHD